MNTRKWCTAALSVAASTGLAAGALTFLAGTASATKVIVVNSCNVTNQDSCSVSATFPNPNFIQVVVIPVPQLAGSPVSLNWTMDCDGITQSGTTNAAIPESQFGDGLVQNMPFTVSDPSSCSMQVTATVLLQQVSSLTVQADYLPDPAPTPSLPLTAFVHGQDGNCLTDDGNRAAARTPVVIAPCSDLSSSQSWTYAGRELKIHKDMCVNAKGDGVSGGKVLLWRCTGAANEIWTHKANGEYVLKAGGSVLCLDDPRSSVASGTQLIVYHCADTSNQRWSLPAPSP